MKFRRLPGFLFLFLLLEMCTSGKVAYKHGDYYDAVLEAVQRLRSSPDNKKSKEVLTLSYQPAIDFLDTDAKNQVASNANLKWKAVVGDYNKINALYENIRTSPGALKVIPDPVSRYNELTLAKDSAAAECYDRAVEAMLKNTRDDAKAAYFLFVDVNNYAPAYRESIEMMAQAKFDATLKIVVQPTFSNFTSWNFDPIMYGARVNDFVKFYSPQEIQTQNIQRVDQYIQVSVNGYSEGTPAITRNVRSYSDSVTLGERTVNGKTVPNRMLITAQMTVVQKTIIPTGTIQVVIRDASSKELINNNLSARPSWTATWGYCTGDQRCIPQADKAICGRGETYPANGQLQVQTKKDLDAQLGNMLANYYKNF